MKKLGIIGCGSIANFHAKAMQAVGFKISAVAGRPGSFENVKIFAKKFKVNQIFDDPNNLILAENSWDALLLACPTSAMIDYIKKLNKCNKPILAEKPITHSLKEIKPFIRNKNISVAFNRRFYQSSIFAKKFLKNNENIFIRITIPERFKHFQSNSGDIKIFNTSTYENSIHIFDLLNFLIGKIKWLSFNKLNKGKNILYFIATGITDRNHLIQLNSCYDSSDNFSIEFISGNKRLELKPIEIATLYEGMEIKQPTKKIPVRQHVPLIVKKISEKNNLFKPGFYQQAIQFMKFCNGDLKARVSIKNLYDAIKLIDDLPK